MLKIDFKVKHTSAKNTVTKSQIIPPARVRYLAEIAENNYELSINRYKEIVHEELKYDPPKKILGRLKKLEAEIAKDLEDLEAMLR